MSLSRHMERPLARGHTPAGGHTGAAGGAACGDLLRISLALDGTHVADAGFDASGCAAAVAAGSAVVALVRGRQLLAAARVGPPEIAAELDGLSPVGQHAADLAADALHRALGAAARTDAALTAERRRTLVAMSGGVDSAVAALLVGPDAIAVTLELWSDPANDGEQSCCSPQAVRGARALAHSMGLAHLSIDLRAEFRAGVVEPWLAAHAAGLTPNPCVRCNGKVRLDEMLDLATKLGADALVTGHYARVEDGLLRAAADPAKDQSYMLAGLAPASIARMRFPLGELRKAEVRELAAAAGLPVARKPDSQDLCFLAGTGRAAFLARHGDQRPRPGPIVDRAGRRLGRHRGQHEYTVGQRRGLGVGGGEPLFVLEKAGDTLVVGPRAELETRRVTLRDAVVHRPGADAVKLRYRQRPLACRVVSGPTDGRIELELLESPRGGVAPGQVGCLMAGQVLVGHGTIV
ncbi:MAG: tRNA 2-thiouridine(34) synthase MnmA [Actinobacteria bacterium]|nr:tRNA 2-thiouridine(34) synthase MnmA [Actinomycetota bacterium]